MNRRPRPLPGRTPTTEDDDRSGQDDLDTMTVEESDLEARDENDEQTEGLTLDLGDLDDDALLNDLMSGFELLEDPNKVDEDIDDDTEVSQTTVPTETPTTPPTITTTTITTNPQPQTAPPTRVLQRRKPKQWDKGPEQWGEGKVPLDPGAIDQLEPIQRLWSNNLLKLLGLQSARAQGRIVAGAIASLEKIKRDGDDDDKREALLAGRVVFQAGKPPWEDQNGQPDAKKAMEVTEAKVKLDLLSIEPTQRKLVPTNTGSKNPSFWINRTESNGQTSKGFLCKPMNMHDTPESGGPPGSEVAREALAGRAANLLVDHLGINLDMPETHVVKLPSHLTDGAQDDQPLTCSVQEFRPSGRSLKDLGPKELEDLDQSQVHGIMVLDTIILNGDRHSGNIMVDENDNLVPIDHGEGFVENSKEGLERISKALGGPYNAMLRVPSAHEPMSEKTVEKLKAFDSTAFGDTLKNDRDVVSSVHPEMQDGISDDAIEMSRRSAEFLKIGAGIGLSPAAIQVAIGSYARQLFDPSLDEDSFQRLAEEIANKVATTQETIKDVCTMPDSMYAVLCQAVSGMNKGAKAPKWRPVGRGGAMPTGMAISDPTTLLSIVQNKMVRPEGKQKDLPGFIDQARDSFKPEKADKTLVKIAQAALKQLLPLLPQDKVKPIETRVKKIEGGILSKKSDKEKKELYIELMTEVEAEATTHQKGIFDQIVQDNDLARLSIANERLSASEAYGSALKFLGEKDLVAFAKEVARLVEMEQTGIATTALVEARKTLDKLLASVQIDPQDEDLRAVEDAFDSGDPSTAFERLRQLDERMTKGEFAKTVDMTV